MGGEEKRLVQVELLPPDGASLDCSGKTTSIFRTLKVTHGDRNHASREAMEALIRSTGGGGQAA